ncbi:hypothetical protein [Streptomyces sp. NBC_01264]|uniref:hypothetical protein n=1 Tax=Streptomyces sp. NBC_01264 TaxID=2903804 RepID=UPI0022557A92|nr:hypothetical protein [Streptomyces sp. NBC_01264]MCX4784528.1 hypothetical protein [Streptomyces sp. NBC_01264]
MTPTSPDDLPPVPPEAGCPDCDLYLAAMKGILADWHPGDRPLPLASELGAALAIFSEHFDQHLQ